MSCSQFGGHNPDLPNGNIVAEVEHPDPMLTDDMVRQNRLTAYQETADPLFFKWQAGEATEADWLEARAAVVDANPYLGGDV